MDLIQLRQMGLVVNNPLVKRTITIKFHPLKPEDTWANPVEPEREDFTEEGTVDFWLRRFTAADQIALTLCADNELRTYEAIHRSVYTEDGKRVFPELEDAYGLDLNMWGGLLAEINKLNGKIEKKSQPKTNGGSASPSPSAAGRSTSGKKHSRRKKSISSGSTPTNTAP